LQLGATLENKKAPHCNWGAFLMAICEWCNQEMTDPKTITTKLKSSTENFNEENGRCHDCFIKQGGKHHPGCDAERCPRCAGQLISCGCLDEDGQK
jgi:hypothetical protein